MRADSQQTSIVLHLGGVPGPGSNRSRTVQFSDAPATTSWQFCADLTDNGGLMDSPRESRIRPAAFFRVRQP